MRYRQLLIDIKNVGKASVLLCHFLKLYLHAQSFLLHIRQLATFIVFRESNLILSVFCMTCCKSISLICRMSLHGHLHHQHLTLSPSTGHLVCYSACGFFTFAVPSFVRNRMGHQFNSSHSKYLLLLPVSIADTIDALEFEVVSY